jgi:hypothetical protein
MSERRLSAIESRIERKEFRTLLRRKTRYYSIIFASQYEFEAQLFVRGKPFPRKKVFTLASIKKENQKLREKFLSTFNESGETNSKMSYWKAVDSEGLKNEKSNYINSRLELIHHKLGSISK